MVAWDDALTWMDKHAVLFLSLFGLAAVGMLCLKACRALLHSANGLHKRAGRRQENKTEGHASGPALEGNTRSMPQGDTKGDRTEQQQQHRQQSINIVQRIERMVALNQSWSTMGIAGRSPGATVEGQIAKLFEHARDLKTEKAKVKHQLKELRRK